MVLAMHADFGISAIACGNSFFSSATALTQNQGYERVKFFSRLTFADCCVR